MTKFCNSLFLSLCVCLLSFGAILAQERGQQVKMADLPAAVQKTVREQSQGAKIEELSKVVEKGKTIYTVEMIVNEHTKELLLDSDGKPTRVAFRVDDETGKKVRVAKTNGKDI